MTTWETRTASALLGPRPLDQLGHRDLGAEVHDLDLAVVLEPLLPREALDVEDRVDADRVRVGADAGADDDQPAAQRALDRGVDLLGGQQRVVALDHLDLLGSTRWLTRP